MGETLSTSQLELSSQGIMSVLLWNGQLPYEQKPSATPKDSKYYGMGNFRMSRSRPPRQKDSNYYGMGNFRMSRSRQPRQKIQNIMEWATSV
jgi:hypothetical protein